MTEYVPVKERFRRRIACELRLMAERARAGGGTCFWVLGNQGSDENAVVEQSGRFRKGAEDPPRRWATGVDAGPDPLVPSRFVQVLLSANKPYFVLDLPNTTIDAHETEVLLRDRLGFIRASERPALGYAADTLQTFDPIAKQYLADDEDCAGDDIAYILFDLWGLAADAPLYVSAARSEGCNCWFEQNVDFDELDCPRPVATVGCPLCLGLVVAGGGE